MTNIIITITKSPLYLVFVFTRVHTANETEFNYTFEACIKIEKKRAEDFVVLCLTSKLMKRTNNTTSKARSAFPSLFQCLTNEICLIKTERDDGISLFLCDFLILFEL